MALGGIIIYIQQNLNSSSPASIPAPVPIRKKKPKGLQPRRGIRFSDDIGRSRPQASFIGSSAMGRTKITAPKKLLQLKFVETLTVSGKIFFGAVGPDGKLKR